MEIKRGLEVRFAGARVIVEEEEKQVTSRGIAKDPYPLSWQTQQISGRKYGACEREFLFFMSPGM